MAVSIINNFNFNCKNKKLSKNVAFGAKFDTNYLYQKALKWHQGMIARTNPADAERYFAQFNIPATFREGGSYARQFVSYCCVKTAEIFRQLQLKLPNKVDLTDFNQLSSQSGAQEAIGLCFSSSFACPNKIYPPRTVAFNTNVDWANFIKYQAKAKDDNFSSSEYFLHPFVHEFAHSLHFDKLFSKYGCLEQTPEYAYNPNVINLFHKMNVPLLDSNERLTGNPFVHVQTIESIKENVSRYGATSLPETFAEIFSKQILDNMDVWNLTLTRNPFPIQTNNKTIDGVLSELWEGLIGDGKGLI